MYQFPLAHDAHGHPVTVPGSATQWRVRRQTGGRPGFVYGPDGAPLVVPLDATADDLRGCGCGPGMYRLDAVDEKGKIVGAVAFTHLEAETTIAEVAAGKPAEQNALVAAMEGMVRTMEAMQRAQAERDKATAQVMLALVEKAGGAKSGDLISSLRQAAQLEDALHEALERRQERIQAAAPEPVVVSAPAEGPVDKTMTTKVLEFVSAIAEVGNKLGINVAEDIPRWLKNAAGEQAAAPPAPVVVQETPRPTVEAPATAPPQAEVIDLPFNSFTTPAAKAKAPVIWAKLSEAERAAVKSLLAKLPPTLLKTVEEGIASISVDEAVAYLRKQLGSAPKTNGTKPAGEAHG